MIVPVDEKMKHSERIKGDYKESAEDEKKAAHLLSADPMDWILKNEHVSPNLISVSLAKLS